MTPDPTITISCDAFVEFADDDNSAAKELKEIVIALPPRSPVTGTGSQSVPSTDFPPGVESRP